MIILGISGFENAIPFKKLTWPGLEEREYRISQGHDSAAVCIVDGELVAAAAEERFSRKKHTGDFPVGAIRYCLAEAGVKAREVDEIVHAFDYSPYRSMYSIDPLTAEQYSRVFAREVLVDQLHNHFPEIGSDKLQHVNHHMAHASSAYFTSGWDECAVVVVDGMGEACSVTAYHGAKNELRKIMEIAATDSIGILYSIVTLHLGFDFNSDEYKIMGLAPYGDPSRFRSFFDAAIKWLDGGRIQIPVLRMNRERLDRETYGATRRHLDEHLVLRRNPDSEITDDHRHVASALQECLDKFMVHVCDHVGKITGQRRLALAGGVALNCTANGKLLRSGLFDEIYVQPAAGDDGTALGAALWRASRHGAVDNRRMPVPFLGPAATGEEVEQALHAFRNEIEVVAVSSIHEACKLAAELITQGQVVAWYRGRMEFGPRALGHRSIVADAGHPEMRDRINAMVKMREAFRPFAPAVTVEQVHQWFDVPPLAEFPYMIMTVDVREEFRATLPAITHVNGSARVQTVSMHDNPEFHMLLKEVGKLTGREMVLNTSFNVKGQPIVNTPAEAIATFLNTGIDCLFVENVFLRRRRREDPPS